MDIHSKVILGYPFAGSLYAFFQNQLDLEKRKAEDMFGHSYYRTLFGDNYNKVTDITLTLIVLFEKVILPPADARIPDVHTYEVNGIYENPVMGIWTSWNDYHSIRVELEEQIEKDLEDPIISNILRRVPDWPKRQILKDIRYNIHLAVLHNCPILCSRGHKILIQRLKELDTQNNNLKLVSDSTLEMLEHYIELFGVIFYPGTIDDLYYIKNNKEIRSYSTSFVKVMNSFKDTKYEEVNIQLLELINKAINTEEIASKASGFFNISSILLSIGGFIPIIGPFLSGLALASSGGSVGISKLSQKQNWYEIAPEIRRLTSIKKVQEIIDKELRKA